MLLENEGTLSLADALTPAIDYAENGFPVSDIIGFQWRQQEDKLAALPSGQEMLVNGRAPREGEVMRLPTLARTLRTVAEGGSEAFYTGAHRVRHGAIRPGAGRLAGGKTTSSRTTRTGTNQSRRTIAGLPAGSARPTARGSLRWRR